MKKLLATAFAALTIAAPAQAQQQPSSLDRFTWARAVTVCLVKEGRSTIKETVKAEIEWLVETGMTYQQYVNFNAASDEDEWLGQRVKEVVTEKGGCAALLSILDAPAPQSKPMPATRPAYLY